jgi:MFS transporter, CP family, cyanate transporter
MKIILSKVLRGSTKSSAFLLLGILVVGATLRAPITIVGPLLDLIRSDFNLSAGQAGVLTALPLAAFAVVSPFVGMLGGRYGLERTLYAGLAIVAAGILLRSSGPAWALFCGTWLIGSGIAAGNVLLPSLLKRDFAANISTATASYTLVMALTSALSSAMATPIARFGNNGWPLALSSVLVLPLLALSLWIPLVFRGRSAAPSPASASAAVSTWRSTVAWQISIFMGLNSLLYYALVSWMPSVLVQAGYSHQEAGSLQGVMHVASAVTALVMVPAGRRIRDQRLAALSTSIFTGCGFAGLAFAPEHAMAWVCLLGVGIGAGMILALSFLSLRASSAPQVAALSSMAQCVGYVLGAAGPLLLGMLHDVQGGWTLPLSECAAIAMMMACAGWLAGRDRRIDAVHDTVRTGWEDGDADRADGNAPPPLKHAVQA